MIDHLVTLTWVKIICYSLDIQYSRGIYLKLGYCIDVSCGVKSGSYGTLVFGHGIRLSIEKSEFKTLTFFS